jgi:hypothetical protein
VLGQEPLLLAQVLVQQLEQVLVQERLWALVQQWLHRNLGLQ